MSQPTGLFSVRRPRETLGVIQNFSGIPQPASAMKRMSSSQDMRAPFTGQHARSTSIQNVQRPAQPNFTRSSSGTNLQGLEQSAVRRSTINPFMGSQSATTHRQSLAPNQLFGGSQRAPATDSVQRRSSIYSRPSAVGGFPGSQTFFTQQVGNPVKREDPRTKLGKAYREQMSRELLDYMTQHNFELDTKHPLRPNVTTSPTQNDFNLMFQWLYKRIDPAYKFQGKIEVELPLLIKQLRYPFGTDISKSHIYPITPQHWPKFLLMFHWMMQLAQMLDNFTRGAYDDACAEAGVDITGDRIVFRFLFSAYQDWLQVSPDQTDEDADKALEPHRQAMDEEFARINAQHEQDLTHLEEENKRLLAEIEEVEKGAPDIAKLEKHFKILEEDKKKFEDYNMNVQNKIEKYTNRIQVLEDEIGKSDHDLLDIDQQRADLQAAVDRQGLNIQDIDRIKNERERLTKAHDDANTQLDTTNKTVLEAEVTTSQRLTDLETSVKRYNTLCYQISLIPSTAANAKGENYELSLQLSKPADFSTSQRSRSAGSGGLKDDQASDRLLAAYQRGYTPQTLLPSHLTNLRDTIRSNLLTLRKQITTRRRTAADTALSDKDLIDSVSELLHEKQADIDQLNYRLSTTKDTYNTLKDDFSTAYTQMTSKREKLESELRGQKDGLDKGVVELEQREMEVHVAWEGMVAEAERIREELHGGIEAILGDVVKFKIRIKEGLESFEGEVGREVENELLGECEEGVMYE